MAFQSSENFTPDNLIAGSSMPIVADQLTLEAGSENITINRGSVLALKSNGKCVLVDSTVSGSDVPYAVVAADTVVAANTDKKAPVFYTGEFNENALKFGGTDTVATHKAAMRKIGIFAKSVIKA